MSQVSLSRLPSRLGLLQIAIIVLAVITALIHLSRGLGIDPFVTHMPPGGFSGRPRGAGGPPPGGFGGGRPGGFGRGGFSLLAYLPIPLPFLFDLDCLAYLVLAITLYLPPLARYRNVLRILLIIVTILTIVGYFLIVGFRTNTFGYVDKAIEITLLVLLLIDAQQARRKGTPTAA